MFKNLHEMISQLKDETACREYLIKERWNGVVTCPYCSCEKVYVVENAKRFKCSKCRLKFSCLVGTIFEASKVPLTKWFHAVYVATAHKKGISSYQLARDLGLSQKTTWFMLHRIREALRQLAPTIVDGTIEIDETYIGGRVANMHKKKRDGLKNKTSPLIKTGVLSIMQREGIVSSHVVKTVTSAEIMPIINARLAANATVITDASKIYQPVTKKYNHFMIDHNIGEFGHGSIYTNSVEGYFSHLKRMIIGIYHQVSPKHLQRYCDELDYRYNSRGIKDATRFNITLSRLETRLSYNKLVNNGKEDKNKITKAKNEQAKHNP